MHIVHVYVCMYTTQYLIICMHSYIFTTDEEEEEEEPLGVTYSRPYKPYRPATITASSLHKPTLPRLTTTTRTPYECTPIHEYTYTTDQSVEIESVPSTHIIPTFCPSSLTPTSTSTGGNDVLVGIAIHFDSIQGHIGCYMTSSGVAASINLSSHVQYCESQIDFQVKE